MFTSPPPPRCPSRPAGLIIENRDNIGANLYLSNWISCLPQPPSPPRCPSRPAGLITGQRFYTTSYNYPHYNIINPPPPAPRASLGREVNIQSNWVGPASCCRSMTAIGITLFLGTPLKKTSSESNAHCVYPGGYVGMVSWLPSGGPLPTMATWSVVGCLPHRCVPY